MNVTPSKILLGLSLAAYGYCSWDHAFPTKAMVAAPAKAGGLTAAMINRVVVFRLERDPFNSVPLGQTLASEAAATTTPGKDLGDLQLNGVMVTFAERAAVVNGKTLHEGETMKTSTDVTIRAKKIGVGYVVIEGAGQIVMLRLDDKKDDGTAAPGAPATPGAPGAPAKPPARAPGQPYVAADKMPVKKK